MANNKNIQFESVWFVPDSQNPSDFKVLNEHEHYKLMYDNLVSNANSTNALKIVNGHFAGYFLIPSPILNETFIFANNPSGYKINNKEFRKSIQISDPKSSIKEFDMQVATEILTDFFASYVEEFKRNKPLVNSYSLSGHEAIFDLPDNIFDINTPRKSAKRMAQDMLEQSIDKLKRDFPALTKEQIKLIKINARKELIDLVKTNCKTGSMMGDDSN